VIGALVGGLVGGGVALVASDDDGDRSGLAARVVGGPNTSTFTKPADVQAVLALVEPAVVAIRAGGGSGQRASAVSSGTGFVISSDGLIVTNNHVIENAGGRISVTFTDGTTMSATLVGRDPMSDVALVKVDAQRLPVAKLGDSEAVQVGDEVIAIGNALALEGGLSVTRGIVSGLNREIPLENGGEIHDAIQTDAAINPGNSGGPLVNSSGEVIGINTAIANPREGFQGVGFSIPVNRAASIIEDLRRGGSVRVAFLGVESITVTEALKTENNLATSTGALVRNVTDPSPAFAVGLQVGDVIVKLDGRDVDSAAELGTLVRAKRPGDQVAVEYFRGGEKRTVTVTLGTRPS